MIKKLLVLNGTEGHKFEVGKQYANTDDVQTVKEILWRPDHYMVQFENGEYVNVFSKNILVFNS